MRVVQNKLGVGGVGGVLVRMVVRRRWAGAGVAAIGVIDGMRGVGEG